jgi:GxxExxY protein
MNSENILTTEEFSLYNDLSRQVIGAAIEVHRELGAGLIESAYEFCLKAELERRGLKAETQVDLPLFYKGEPTGKFYRIDLLVENRIVVELKAVEKLLPIHEVQLVTYLKLTNKAIGLLINFNVPILKDGIKRKINARIEYTGIKPLRNNS